MVVIKLLALGAVHRRRRDAPQPGELHAVRAERLHRHPSGRGDRVLRLHRLRRDLDGGRGDEEPAAQPADRHPRRPRDLHGHLRHRRRRADRHGAVHRSSAVADPLARALQLAGLQRGRLDRRARRGGLDVGGAARVPVRPAAHLLRDGARRPAAAVGGEASPEDADPVRHDAVHRHLRGAVVADRRRRRDLRPDEHRHAVRVHAGQHRRAGAALQGAGPAASVPRAVRLAGLPRLGGRLPVHHAGLPRAGVGAVRHLARCIGLVLYFVYGYQAQPGCEQSSA